MTKKKSNRKLPRHPWDKWFQKKRFVLKRKVHFSGMPHAMGVQVRKAAAKRNILVSIAIKEDSIVVLTSKDERSER